MDVFDALADPVRRDLLLRLAAEGPTRVTDLAADHGISRPAISRHLKVLGDASLVAMVSHGREHRYGVTPAGLGPVRDLLARLAATVAPVSGSMLDALDLEVRRTVRDRAADPVTLPASRQRSTA